MKPAHDVAHTLLRCAIAALSLWFVFAFLYVALNSLFYPFQLEWIEGQSMDIARRVARGTPIYTEPTIHYVSLLYTPLFYYFTAFTSYISGMEFHAGRIVSILATIGTAILLGRWVRREGGGPIPVLAAAGLFFATYTISGRWFDLARVDSLSVFLTLTALCGLRFGRDTATALATGGVICAAFFAKQSALALLLPVALALLLTKPRYSLAVLISAALWLALSISIAEALSSNWFSFFTYTIPTSHRTDPVRYVSFWRDDVLLQQGPALAACLLALWHSRKDRPTTIFYAAALAAALISTYAARLHMYGYINNLMPLHAALSLIAGLGLASLLKHTPKLALTSASLITAQLALLLYNPTPLIPTEASLAKGNDFLKTLQQYPGEAFLPDVQFIPERTHKNTFSYGMGAYDVFRSTAPEAAPVKARLAQELQTAIAQENFGIIIPGRLIHNALPGLNAHYRPVKQVDYPEGYALDSMNLRRMVFYVPIHSKP